MDNYLLVKEKNKITVVMSSSSFYVPYLTVVIYSIIKAGNLDTCYEIIILNREISNEQKKLMHSFFNNFPNIQIRFLHIDKELQDCDYNYRENYVAESFYRVIMLNLLKEYEKIIYLDCDVIVLEDLAKLYSIDLEGYFAGVVRDPAGIGWCGKNHDGRKEYMKEVLGLTSHNDYFQSGVMVFNLRYFRENYTLKDVIEAASNPQIIWGDQDVLNQMFAGRVKYLENSWNTIVNNDSEKQIKNFDILASRTIFDEYMIAREKPYIIHYAGNKPWKVPDSDYAWIFWEYARQTPFYNAIIERDIMN